MAAYDKESSVYDRRRFNSKGGQYIDGREKRLVAKHAEGPFVLEIGTATGRFISFVRAMGWHYTGLDISRRMLLRAATQSCELALGDGEVLPFSSECFDSVICLHTFHFLPDPPKCVEESYRVLKRGGSLILVFEMDTWLRRLVIRTGLFKSNQYYFKVEEVAQLMKRYGFEVRAQRTVLKLPMEAYRKLPMTRFQRAIDASPHWPNVLATLGFVVGAKTL